MASDIAALREVGGQAATYCPVGDVGAWVAAISELLDERAAAPRRLERASRGRPRAMRGASAGPSTRGRMTEVYRELLPHVRPTCRNGSRGFAMSALRILHLGKYYPPDRGGIETVVETLCRGERAGRSRRRALVLNKVSRTTRRDPGRGAGSRVASVATVGAVSVAPSLPLWLARAEADVIVLHEPNPMALLAYALARPEAPLIVWFHSEVIRPQLAVPAVLRAVARLRAAARPADRRGVAADAATCPRSPRISASAP